MKIFWPHAKDEAFLTEIQRDVASGCHFPGKALIQTAHSKAPYKEFFIRYIDEMQSIGNKNGIQVKYSVQNLFPFLHNVLE